MPIFSQLIGGVIWQRMFPGGVQATDYTPHQLKQLVAHQMRSLHARLSDAEHTKNREAGREAFKESRKVIRSNTKKISDTKKRLAKKGAEEDL